MLEELAKALRKRLEIINDQTMREANAENHLRMLAEISGEIDSLSRILPQDVHPRLRHFLERASYSKALELLETELIRK